MVATILKNAYFNVPYTPLAQQIRAGGFTGGTIIIDFRRYQIGGNLRIKFPDSRVISTKFPYYVPPPRQPGGQCLLIWNAAEHMALPENLRAYAQQKFGVEPGANDRTRVVEAFFLHSNTRRFKLGILLVTGKPGRCR